MPAAPLSQPRTIGLVLALGFSQVIAFAASFYLLSVLADPIAYDLEIAASTVFAIFSGAMLLQAGISPFTGRLIDRIGAKPVLLASMAGIALGLVGLAEARSLVSLAAALCAMGIGMAAGLYAGPNALAVEVFGEGARQPITVISLVGGFGSTTAWMVTPLLVQAIGWRGACLVWAGVLLGAVIPPIAILAPSSRLRPALVRDRTPIPWDRRMLQLALLFVGTWFVAAGVAAHLPRLLEAVGLQPVQAARIAGFLGLAAVSARLMELTVLRGAQPLLIVRLASAAPAVGALLVAVFGAPAGMTLVLLQGLRNGVLSVANGTLPLLLWGREGYATRSALLNTPAKFAQTAAPFVFAVTLDRGPGWALALIGGLSLAMLAATLGLDPRRAAPETVPEPA